MNTNEDFWDDVLGHIEEQRLVPVVGPELTVINTGNVEVTFSSLIGQRLARSMSWTRCLRSGRWMKR